MNIYKTILRISIVVCFLNITAINSIEGRSINIDGLSFTEKLYGEGDYYHNQSGLYNKSGKWVYYYDKNKQYKAAEVEYYDNSKYLKMNLSALPNGIGIVNGKFVTFYYRSNNKYIEGEFNDGDRDGYWTVYSKDGQVVAEGSYNIGIPHGNYKFYFENGNVCDVQYGDGGIAKFTRGNCGGAKLFIGEFPLIP